MGLGGGRKGKTGAYSTGADVLEELAAQGHDLPARVLDWRLLSKLKSTYTDTLQDAINPETGRVHTSYLIAGAATGRLASTDPNLQNIPVRTEEGRRIREAFVAEPGNVLAQPRLFPDRAAHPRAHGRHRGAEGRRSATGSTSTR